MEFINKAQRWRVLRGGHRLRLTLSWLQLRTQYCHIPSFIFNLLCCCVDCGSIHGHTLLLVDPHQIFGSTTESWRTWTLRMWAAAGRRRAFQPPSRLHLHF